MFAKLNIFSDKETIMSDRSQIKKSKMFPWFFF